MRLPNYPTLAQNSIFATQIAAAVFPCRRDFQRNPRTGRRAGRQKKRRQTPAAATVYWTLSTAYFICNCSGMSFRALFRWTKVLPQCMEVE
jgi:hypothetical protein